MHSDRRESARSVVAVVVAVERQQMSAALDSILEIREQPLVGEIERPPTASATKVTS